MLLLLSPFVWGDSEVEDTVDRHMDIGLDVLEEQEIAIRDFEVDCTAGLMMKSKLMKL